MPYEGRFLDSDRIHERIDIGGEVLQRVAALWLIRLPVPALGERESMVLGREQGEHPAEGEPRIGVAVEEKDRFPSSIAAFGVVEANTRREGRRCGELDAV